MKWTLIAAGTAVLMACSSPEEMSQGLGLNENAGALAADTLKKTTETDDTAKGVEFKDEEKEGEAARDFSYSWPAKVSAIPGLVSVLTEKRTKALEAQKSEWNEAVAEFGTDSCITCVNRSYGNTWSVLADTPGVMILQAERYMYTGGAHGNTGFETLAWDKKANEGKGKAMMPIDLFADPVALENTAYGEYCQALHLVRSERRGVDPTTVSKFENCPSVSELSVLVTSSNGETFDGITFLAAPYVAGAYAEGPYEFAIAVSPAIIEIVKPEYRDAFAIGAG